LSGSFRVFGRSCRVLGCEFPRSPFIYSHDPCSLQTTTARRYFGSVGSFFSFRPSAGSFQVNPPFDPETVKKSLEHMKDVLLASSEALSFVLIIPFGGTIQAEALKNSMQVSERATVKGAKRASAHSTERPTVWLH